jgi:hypothetical protein
MPAPTLFATLLLTLLPTLFSLLLVCAGSNRRPPCEVVLRIGSALAKHF